MVPPMAVIKDDEVFDAFEAAQEPVLTISKPGRRTLAVIDASAGACQEEPLSESDVASLKSGIADFEDGRYIEATVLVEKLRAKYGLYR